MLKLIPLIFSSLHISVLFSLLPLSQPPPGKIPSREEQELLSAQLERIHTLFRRQLAVPLMGEHGDSSVQMDCCKLGGIPVVSWPF